MSEIGGLLDSVHQFLLAKYPHNHPVIVDADERACLERLTANDGVITQAATGLQVVAELLRIADESKEKGEIDLNGLSWLILCLTDIIEKSDFIRSEAEYHLREGDAKPPKQKIAAIRSRA
jgi:hypothetical protein